MVCCVESPGGATPGLGALVHCLDGGGDFAFGCVGVVIVQPQDRSDIGAGGAGAAGFVQLMPERGGDAGGVTFILIGTATELLRSGVTND